MSDLNRVLDTKADATETAMELSKKVVFLPPPPFFPAHFPSLYIPLPLPLFFPLLRASSRQYTATSTRYRRSFPPHFLHYFYLLSSLYPPPPPIFSASRPSLSQYSLPLYPSTIPLSFHLANLEGKEDLEFACYRTILLFSFFATLLNIFLPSHILIFYVRLRQPISPVKYPTSSRISRRRRT